MYRGASLACPACGGALEIATASLPIHGCRGCGGMWLGPDATMHLLQGRGGALESELVESDQRASRAGVARAVVPDGEPRRCPSCALEMAPLLVRDVRVDSCPTHGTWFDRLEVTRVTKEILQLRRARRRRTELSAGTRVLAETGRRIVDEVWAWLTRGGRHDRGCECGDCARAR
ncbi:MAG: zf-TFIIB domain-containing protein [Labilithrix sp.]|nr:zf-TFIIB domain-containing protein [Labilithrix sp.]MCW5835511.1 zf-TFIIB domain-containing protein [Labilithrix sp.]